MNRIFLTFAVCAVGVGGLTLARHVEMGGAKVTQLSRRDIVEKLDGKDAKVTVEELAIEPSCRCAAPKTMKMGASDVSISEAHEVGSRPSSVWCAQPVNEPGPDLYAPKTVAAGAAPRRDGEHP
jgi:hypothetical protein